MLSFPEINSLAIFTCAVFLWVLGAAWYSPAMFAKQWMELIGVTREPGRRDGLLLGMTASFFGDVVMSFVLANIVSWAHVSGFGKGGILGVVIWMGFVAAPNLPQGLYEKRPFKLFAINSGYWLVGLFIAGGILASWR